MELRNWEMSHIKFLERMNPAVLEKNFASAPTAMMAMTVTKVTLSIIADTYGGNTHIIFIKANLVKLQDFLNVKDENLLDSAILTELSTYIYEDYKTLTIAEFALVIKQIKKGHYGQIYARIDPVFIQACFKRYQQEQRSAAMLKLQSKDETHKVQFTSSWYQWAKNRLLKDFKTRVAMMDHLQAQRKHLCAHCQEAKSDDCHVVAAQLIEKETVNTYAIATWLLCWNFPNAKKSELCCKK